MNEFDQPGIKEFYNKVYSQYYDPMLHAVSCCVRKLNEMILRELRTTTAGKILDVGCGGQNPVADSVGCDLSIEALRLRRHNSPSSINICADIYDPPFRDGTFKAILASHMFDHLEYPAKALASLRRTAKLEATLDITIFDSNKLPESIYANNKFIYRSFDGRSYLVPSYSWSIDFLGEAAKDAGWKLQAVDRFDTPDEIYKLLRLHFSPD